MPALELDLRAQLREETRTPKQEVLLRVGWLPAAGVRGVRGKEKQERLTGEKRRFLAKVRTVWRRHRPGRLGSFSAEAHGSPSFPRV